jgi:hypothetical protein
MLVASNFGKLLPFRGLIASDVKLKEGFGLLSPWRLVGQRKMLEAGRPSPLAIQVEARHTRDGTQPAEVRFRQDRHASAKRTGRAAFASRVTESQKASESWPDTFGQRDKWGFCLRAATMAVEQERR